VKAGDPLFPIDDRAQRAQVAIQTAGFQVAEADLRNANYELMLAEGLTQKQVTSVESPANHDTKSSSHLSAKGGTFPLTNAANAHNVLRASPTG
jgi:multidrug resistance efflux pump